MTESIASAPGLADPYVAHAAPSPANGEPAMAAFAPPTRPYPGLRPFAPHESEIFFGRERHTDRLLEILQRERFLSVTGPSGSGKSSLVRAGLLPMLSLGALGTGTSWRFAYMRPGDRPLASLARALLAPLALGRELGDRATDAPTDGAADEDLYLPQRIEAELRRGPLGLAAIVDDARRAMPEDERDANLLVLVDQFEEIFTYADAGAREADEADAFVDLLVRTREQEQARVFIVLTMRTDFLGACVRFQQLPDLINRTQYLTPRLTRDEMARAIASPARLFGWNLDGELVTELVNSVGRDLDQLPVLQHALARMWDRAVAEKRETQVLTLTDLEQVGGTANALDRHAEEVLAALEMETRPYAELLFRAITEQRSTEAGGQVVRRPQSLERIAAWTGQRWERFLPVLTRFADPAVNFVTFRGAPDAPSEGAATVIDISHESLMRQWTTLKQWIARERDAADRFQELRRRTRAYAAKQDVALQGVALNSARKWLREGLLVGDPKQPIAALSTPTAAWAARYGEGDVATRAATFGDVRRFVRRSQGRQLLLNSAIGVVAAAALFMAAAWFIGETKRARLEVVNALWEPFRSGRLTELDAAGPDDPRMRGALAVAGAPQGDRERFLDLAFQDSTLAAQLSDTVLLQAVVGVDAGMRDALRTRLGAAPSTGPGAVPATPRALAIRWLGGRPTFEQSLGGIMATIDPLEIDALVGGFRDAAAAFDTSQATAWWPRLVETMATTQDSDQRRALETVLGAVAERLAAPAARDMARALLDSMVRPDSVVMADTVARPLDEIAVTYRALAARLSPADAGGHARALVAAMMESNDVGRQEAIGESMAALVDSVAPGIAAVAVGQLTRAVLTPSDPERTSALGEALRVLAGRLAPNDAADQYYGLLALAVQSENQGPIFVLGSALQASAQRIAPTRATAAAREIARALLQTSRVPVTSALAPALTVLAPHVDASMRPAALVRALIDAMRESSVSRSDCADAIVALVPKLGAPEAGGLLASVVTVVGELRIPSRSLNEMRSWDRVLQAIAERVDDAHARAALPELVASIGAARTVGQVAALGQALETIVGRIDGPLSRAQRELLVDALASRGSPSVGSSSPLLSPRAVGYAVSPAATRAAVIAASLEVAAPRLDSASAVAGRLLGLIDRTQERDSLAALGMGLRALACCIDDATRAAVDLNLAAALRSAGTAPAERDSSHTTKPAPSGSVLGRRDSALVARGVGQSGEREREVNEWRLAALSMVAAGATAGRPPSEVGADVGKHLRAIKSARTREQVEILGDALTAMARTLDTTRVGPALDTLHALMTAEQAPYVAFYAARTANLLLARAALRGPRARQWLEATRSPLLDRSVVAGAVRRGVPGAPAAAPGEWPVLAWSAQRSQPGP